MARYHPVFAIVTPFLRDLSAPDLPALRDQLQFLSRHGVRRVVVNGTTGEFPSLTPAEKRLVLETARTCFPGQVIAHVSACSVGETREALHHARHHADAALLLPPWYFANPAPAGVFQFLAAVCEDSPIPVYLYNFPRHTQFTFTPGLVQDLANRLPQIRGLKDSGGDPQLSRDIKAMVPRLEVMVGSDTRALAVLQEGLDGSVTGGGVPVPEPLCGIASAFLADDLGAARLAQSRFDAWTNFRKTLQSPEISVAKAGLAARIPGFPTGVRPPLTPPSQVEQDQISAWFSKTSPS